MKASAGTLYHAALGILQKSKPINFSKKVSKMNLTEYAEEITKRGIDLDEQIVRSEGAAPSTIKQFIDQISGVSGFEDAERINYVSNLKVNSLIPGHEPVTIKERQEEFFKNKFDELSIRLKDSGLNDAGFKAEDFGDDVAYSARYNKTIKSLNKFAEEDLKKDYYKEQLNSYSGKEFNDYYSGLTDEKKAELAKIASEEGRKIESVKSGEITYYYREGDKLPPEIEEARQRSIEKKRQSAKKQQVREQQSQATKSLDNHEIYIPKNNKPVSGKMNPTNSNQPRYLTDEEIIDSLMNRADNVNSGAQSELANPVNTTLRNSVRLSELSMNGFTMEKAGTLMGTLGALTLFEASMYADNADAELHKRRVEEERRRKKYGY